MLQSPELRCYTALTVGFVLVVAISLWLQGGTVVNHDQQLKADVLISGGLVQQVAPNIKVGQQQQIAWYPNFVFSPMPRVWAG